MPRKSHIKFLLTGILLLLTAGTQIGSAQNEQPEESSRPTYVLNESNLPGKTFAVEYDLDVTGQVEERVPDNETRTFKIESTATLKYSERHLPSAGRNEAALRSIRFFDQHQTDVTIGDRKTELRLPQKNRLFVVEGRNFELLYYPPSALLSANVLEQLRIPFDSLASLGLLPRTAVKQGDTWKPETWALQLLTGVEAILKQECLCTLTKVDGNIAFVKFEGKVSGGRFGAATAVRFIGQYEFDLDRKYLRDLVVSQTEKSSISPVSPGLDVAANIHFTRTPQSSHPQLTDKLAESIPLDPDPVRLLLAYTSPWEARLLHTRNWHVIPGKFVLLRLMDSGSLITQGTMMGLPKMEPGKHVPEEQFQKDIVRSLGKKLSKVQSAEEIETTDGRFLYRVIANGNSNGRAMTWIYYLAAHPDGRQVSFVFSTESELMETLNERDIDLIRTIQWPKAVTPTRAVSD